MKHLLTKKEGHEKNITKNKKGGKRHPNIKCLKKRQLACRTRLSTPQKPQIRLKFDSGIKF